MKAIGIVTSLAVCVIVSCIAITVAIRTYDAVQDRRRLLAWNN